MYVKFGPTVKLLSPLLNATNPHSTLITLTMRWTDEVVEYLEENDDFDKLEDMEERARLAVKPILGKRYTLKKFFRNLHEDAKKFTRNPDEWLTV